MSPATSRRLQTAVEASMLSYVQEGSSFSITAQLILKIITVLTAIQMLPFMLCKLFDMSLPWHRKWSPSETALVEWRLVAPRFTHSHQLVSSFLLRLSSCTVASTFPWSCKQRHSVFLIPTVSLECYLVFYRDMAPCYFWVFLHRVHLVTARWNMYLWPSFAEIICSR